MSRSKETQQTNLKYGSDVPAPEAPNVQEGELLAWVERFLIARKAEGLTPGSLRYHREKLANLLGYCNGQAITRVEQITTNVLRDYFVYLADGHNSGGVAGFYRSVKAFFLWLEAEEVMPDGWRCPIRRIKTPRVDEEPLSPVELETVQRMVAACPTDDFTGARDKALLWMMLDTGARAKEILSLNLTDINPTTGVVHIGHSKSRKPRDAFLGKKARRAYKTYLKYREKDGSPVAWLNRYGERLQYDGLRAVLDRRAELAGVEPPSAHAFRRAFCLEMLRRGVDLVTLSRLMGHKGLEVLQKYLRQLPDDLQAAHRRGGPVDHIKWGPGLDSD